MHQPRPRVMALSQLIGAQAWRLSLAHDRPENVLIWIARGQGRLLLDGRRRGISTNSVVFVPAGDLFAVDIGLKTGGHIMFFPPCPGTEWPEEPCHFKVREPVAVAEIGGLIDAAAREQHAARDMRHQALNAFGALLAISLQRQLVVEGDGGQRCTAAQRLCSAYCARVTTSFHEPLSMADHASYLGVTATHLTRACKAATGRTAADLLTERKLYEARKLLMSTRTPAQDIARNLGFGSAAYFTRFMTHHTKSTPTALRRAALELAEVA